METLTKILPFIFIYFVFVLVITSFKGLKYDRLSGYKKNHSFDFDWPYFSFILPISIKEKSKKEEIEKARIKYNYWVKVFWYSVLFCLVGYSFFYLQH